MRRCRTRFVTCPPCPPRCMPNTAVISALLPSAPAELWLATHKRTAHKLRSQLRLYLDGSGVCPVCSVQFSSLLRLLAHVSERRSRGKSSCTCRSALEPGKFPQVPCEVVASLDAADRARRGKARREGRCVPPVVVRTQRSKVRGLPDKRKINNVDACLAPVERPVLRRSLRYKQPGWNGYCLS